MPSPLFAQNKYHFENPDFAYPKTVEKNASKILTEALSSHDDAQAIQAALQVVIAHELSSTDSIAADYALLADLPQHLSHPYSDVACLLPAILLHQMYQADKWQYDEREIPDTPLADNPEEWSGRQFQNQIRHFCDLALSHSEAIENIPLTDINALLANGGNWGDMGYSVLDFISLKTIDLKKDFLSEELQHEAIERLIAIDSRRAETDETARYGIVPYLKLKNISREDGDRATALIHEYANTPAEIKVLCYIYRNIFYSQEIEWQQDFFRILEDTKQSAKKQADKRALLDMIVNIKRPSVKIRTDEYAAPGVPITAQCEFDNLKSGYLLLLQIDNAYRDNNIFYQARKDSRIAANASVVQARQFDIDSPYPFSESKTITFDGVKPGCYLVALSTSPDKKDIIDIKSMDSRINVSSIAYNTAYIDGKGMLIMTDATTGRPLENVVVTMTDARWRSKGQSPLVTTSKSDAHGMIQLPDYQVNCKASYQSSAIYFYCSPSGSSNSVAQRNFEILTDLGIYRPGQKLQAVIIGERIGIQNHLSPLSGHKITAVFYDANYEKIEQKDLTTDLTGRAVVDFDIPTDRLTGTYSIDITDGFRNTAGHTTFEVAEYKTPTFKVNLSRPDGKEIALAGNVFTYSGMPLADAKVAVEIRFQPWWWRKNAGNAKTILLNAVTDSEGNFSVNANAENLKGIDSGYGLFSAVATAVSPTGESQKSPSIQFCYSDSYSISANIPTKVEAKDKEIIFRVNVTDALGNPAKKPIKYRIEGVYGSKAILEGDFISPILTLPSSSLPSGSYKMTFTYADADNLCHPDSVAAECVIWRKSDKKSPAESSVWTPQNNITAEKDAKEVKIQVGSAYSDGWILMIVSNSKGTSYSRWLKPASGLQTISVEAPEEGNRILVTFASRHNMTPAIENVLIRPYEETIHLTLTPEIWRDKISPNSEETFSFRFNLEDAAGIFPLNGDVYAMAVMSDEALTAIVPFFWSLGGLDKYSWRYPDNFGYMSVDLTYTYLYNFNNIRYGDEKLAFFANPTDFNTYGRPLYNGRRGMIRESLVGSALVAGDLSAPTSMKSAQKRGIPSNMKFEESDEAELESADTGGAYGRGSKPTYEEENKFADVEMHEVEHPLAFFYPNLTADKDGNLEISFKTPSINTRWLLQIAGYTPDMKNVTKQFSITASRPLMIQPNLPRFLRTADKTSLDVAVFNNSDESLSPKVSIEIIDHNSGSMIASQILECGEIAPAASAKVALSFSAPSSITSLEVRIKAISEAGSDGEQSLIPVLPATMSVSDAVTFYLSADETSAEIPLPDFPKDARISVDYCDNPLWFVFTQLNDLIEPASASAFYLAYSLYSNHVSQEIVKRNPAIAERLRQLADTDSELLTSPLEQRDSLKQLSLAKTPWVGNAKYQTERMQNLTKLLYPAQYDIYNSEIWRRLTRLQNPDGGFRWYDSMHESSAFVTYSVLECLARMRRADAWSSSYDEAMARGVAYCDSDICREFLILKSRKREQEIASYALPYLYIRTSLGLETSGQLKRIESIALSYVQNHWKGYEVAEKCKATIWLDKTGHHSLAKEIMESVREYATVSKSKGMYFDNPTGVWSRVSPINTAALAVEAFKQVCPGDKAIDLLDQYLILSCQTEDWNLNLGGDAVAAASAVLSTTSYDAVAERNPAKVWIDESGKMLHVEREPGVPAWGGVIAIYDAPMKDIKSAGMEQLSIEKRLYPVVSDDGKRGVGNASTSFKKGDTILVSLTITTDRALDYVVVTDARGACMEPKEQLTKYVSQDGLPYLREQRDSATNLYFLHFPKGKFIINYEVTADRDGEYASGCATAQSYYFPLITARSNALELVISH